MEITVDGPLPEEAPLTALLEPGVGSDAPPQPAKRPILSKKKVLEVGNRFIDVAGQWAEGVHTKSSSGKNFVLRRCLSKVLG